MSQFPYVCDILGSEIASGDEMFYTTPGGERHVFDIYTLAKTWVLTGKEENPFTRQPLSEDDSRRIREYRKITLVLPDGIKHHISGVCPVWLAIITIIRMACGSIVSCIQFDVRIGCSSLYDMELCADLWSIAHSVCSVDIRPHTVFTPLRKFADALAEQQEPEYKELAIEIRTHLRRGSLTRRQVK